VNGLVVLLIVLVLLAIQVAALRTTDASDAVPDDEPDPDLDAGDAVARHIGALNYGTPEHALAARRQLLAIGPSVVDALLDWLHALERRPTAITAHTRLRFEDLLVDFGLAGLLRIRPALSRFDDDHPAWPGLLRVLARLDRGAVEQLVRDDEAQRRRTLDRIVATLPDASIEALLIARATWADRLAARLDDALLPVVARRIDRLDPVAVAPLHTRLAVEFGIGEPPPDGPLERPLAANLDVPDERLTGDARIARAALNRHTPAPEPALAEAFDLGPGAARERLVQIAARGPMHREAGVALARLGLVDRDGAAEILAERVRSGRVDGPAGWGALALCRDDGVGHTAWLADVLRNATGETWAAAVSLCHGEQWDALLVPALEAIARRPSDADAAPLVRLLVGHYDRIGADVRAHLTHDRAEVRQGARVVVAWTRDARAVPGVLAGLDHGDAPDALAPVLEAIGAPAARALHDIGDPIAPALARVRDLCTALAERGTPG